MEKRLFFATSLSLLFLLIWSYLISKFYHIENKGVVTETPTLKTSVSGEARLPHAHIEIPAVSILPVSSEKFTLIFQESEASLKEVSFKEYSEARFSLLRGLAIENKDWIFQKENSPSAQQIAFVCADKDKRVVKKFSFSNSNYTIELEISIQNLSSNSLRIRLPLVLGVLDFSGNQFEARYQDVTLATGQKIMHLNGRKELRLEEVQFLALRNRYFCAILAPDEKNHYTAFLQRINGQKTKVGLQSPELNILPHQTISQKFRIYLGPQNLRFINAVNPDWSAAIHYGAFNLIAQLLLLILDILYQFVHNWGIAIILLSLFIYLLLFPLTLKQMRSMKEMQRLQPRLEELRNLYKNNPQRLNKEIMELYREYKINPFSGCLPLIFQIPIFFALYQVLMRCVALKGARFLWIKDLSEPDRLFVLSYHLPLLGNEINLLPLLMLLTMFMQQKFSLRTTPGTSAQQQKLMLILFPVIFGLIFYHLPSGLVLYWFINNILMLGFQWRMKWVI
ncbi:MAG: membrane protein insertase YidC [Candidatus Omnitrophica bacterium]|nr:membrane protein insertase YidC [Candidatus Omnitrophota bacterium]